MTGWAACSTTTDSNHTPPSAPEATDPPLRVLVSENPPTLHPRGLPAGYSPSKENGRWHYASEDPDCLRWFVPNHDVGGVPAATFEAEAEKAREMTRGLDLNGETMARFLVETNQHVWVGGISMVAFLYQFLNGKHPDDMQFPAFLQSYP